VNEFLPSSRLHQTTSVLKGLEKQGLISSVFIERNKKEKSRESELKKVEGNGKQTKSSFSNDVKFFTDEKGLPLSRDILLKKLNLPPDFFETLHEDYLISQQMKEFQVSTIQGK